MARLLITDDEEEIREVVKEYGEINGYQVDEAADGMQALDLIRKTAYDCVILDVMMPKLDGFSACREIKKIQDVPIIILSARQEEYDKLFGFELGVDDYVVKPFSPKELMARVKAVIARRHPSVSKKILQYGGLVIDVDGREVTVDGEKTAMTPKEIDLLIELASHPGVALSRERLLSDVWDIDFFGDDRTVDSHIKMLRAHLGPYRDYIVTVRGMGYKFEA
ncbi:response regulator transcription factor [Stecheria sp. CLA-KB-P133]|uniref:Response regulator transcription factor n=1 Tax=Grylomicrobium aquisgranensis TaxID=2926318 RepID=A0AB35U184_9FIRM|nr:response regulator transcription factor [Lactimicrobium massiliense]MDD6229099.1 response regulator transcription factor [Lactimicrobium massiliense]MDD6674951.1 response regulator transcription factor [Lactimicrobium massiliense]MDX8419210.1 response regulator transcription factor [Stecheria sp. CLA-KB-P133]MDY3931812.1 response regulator transcription factor [Erysipelotrichaceae bacterium]